MDNERFTLDKRRRKIAIIGAGHTGSDIHLMLEASLLIVDDCQELRGMTFDGVVVSEIVHYAISACDHSMYKPIPAFPKERKRSRGGGHYDRKGRRRR